MPGISVVIPTYRRERVLIDTLEHLLRQLDGADELLLVDQSEQHEQDTEDRLQRLELDGVVRRIRQALPSITVAMNRGLLEARCETVLFVDDDIVPESSLVHAHKQAHAVHSRTLVAGRVLQPWDREGAPRSVFADVGPAWVDEFMGGNFSVRRNEALAIGGFDENFVQVAYRFEAEFASRFRAAGGRIRFEPLACLHHLRAARGGTRSYGDHLTTVKPAHAVGAYYYSLRTQSRRGFVRECFARPVRAVATKHHLRRPWWIPATLAAELRGMWWALRLHAAGPRLIGTAGHVS